MVHRGWVDQTLRGLIIVAGYWRQVPAALSGSALTLSATRHTVTTT